MKSKCKVDFFIIGAPKAGTTSLANYLEQHPKVCFSSIKEPFYFNQKTPKFRGITKATEYNNLFSACATDSIKGEGTTWYLYSEEAVDNILEHNPDARFIVCLRNPVDSVISWHKQALLTGAEDLEDVTAAWNAQAQRKADGYLPPVYDDLSVLMYGDIYKLGTQMQRLYSKVAKEHVHVILFEEIQADTQQVYQGILDFLALPAAEGIKFDIHYPRSSTKNKWIKKIGVLFSYRQRVLLAYYLKRTGIDIYKLYLGMNTKAEPKKEIPQQLRTAIKEHYQEEILLLARVIDKDLSAWLKD